MFLIEPRIWYSDIFLVLNQWWLLATFSIAIVDFDVTDQLLLTYSAFVTDMKKPRVQWDSPTTIYRVQVSLMVQSGGKCCAVFLLSSVFP
jgi:hypothetical protein